MLASIRIPGDRGVLLNMASIWSMYPLHRQCAAVKIHLGPMMEPPHVCDICVGDSSGLARIDTI